MNKYRTNIAYVWVIFLISFFSVTILSATLNAQKNLRFTENKGQWNNNVLYKANIPSGSVFLESNSILFNFREASATHHAGFNDENYKKNDKVKRHAYRINFLKSLTNGLVTNNNKGAYYENFYIGSNRDKWATKANNYGVINYQSIYRNIDLKIYGQGNNLKYDFIVHAGADPTQIKLFYDGVKSIKLRKGNLIVKTTINKITEYKPIAYQIIDGDTIIIECKFRLRKKTVSYDFPNGYNSSHELVIDPFLVFSTYSGSTADNWGFTATFDSLGNVYSGGIVSGPGYPVTTGVYQDTLTGGDPIGNTFWDIGIIKYDSTGTQRLWATYLGGSGDEMPHSLIVDNNNNLLIFGTTGSNDFPMSVGAYDNSFNGGTTLSYDNVIGFSNGSDIYIAKLSEDGTSLLASTYVGGSDNDGINFRQSYDSFLMDGNDSLYYNYGDGARGEIIIDNQNSIYIGSCTFSSDFPTSSTSFQPNLSGKQEGIVFKLNSNLSTLMWSSYFGGSNDDAIYSVDVDNNGNAYIAGGTNSTNLATSSTALHPNYQGGSADGFVAKINPDGTNILSASYFGSPEYDQVYFVRVDEINDIFVTGQTKATGSTLIFNAQYNNPNSGQFIAKLPNNLTQLEWSTVFGTGSGKPNISITAFAVDNSDKIYLSGWGRDWNNTEGTMGMETTPGAYQSITDGQDFYIMILTDDAACLKYATFFGEQKYAACGNSGRDHVDGGTSRFDKRGYIYQAVCASCGGCQHFPTYPNPGAWSNSNNASNCNNAVFKFELDSPIPLPDLHVCNNEETTLGFISNDTVATYEWFPAALVSNATILNPLPLSTVLTEYMLIIHNNFCVDTIYQTYYPHFLGLNLVDTIEICDYETVAIAPIITLDTAIVQWSSSADFSNIIPTSSDTLFANPDSTTMYYIMISSEYCTLFDSVFVNVHNVSINAISDFIICYGDSMELNAISNYPGQNITYTWQPTNVILSGQNTANPFIYITQPTAFTVNAYNSFGCTDTDSLIVSISTFSTSTYEIIIPLSDTIFESQSIIISTQSPDSLTYSWFPTTWLDNTTTTTVIASPNQSLWTYVAVTDDYGCVRLDSIYIYIENIYCNEDHIFVPSAFSPNGDNYNDILYVQSRMTNDIYFAVYDKWGEKVFETNDITIGWDGSYKGENLYPGVFVYYLKAICWNKTTLEKRGNVTLLK